MQKNYIPLRPIVCATVGQLHINCLNSYKTAKVNSLEKKTIKDPFPFKKILNIIEKPNGFIF